MKKIKSYWSAWKDKYFMPITSLGLVIGIVDFLLIKYYLTTDFNQSFPYTYASLLELMVWVMIVIINAILIWDILTFLLSMVFIQFIMKDDTARYFHFIASDEINHLQIKLPFWARPLLGSLKLEVHFEQDIPFKSFPIQRLNTQVHVPLDNIMAYHLKSFDLWSNDMFHLFRWKRRWSYHQSILQAPITIDDFNAIKIQRAHQSDEMHSNTKVYSPGEWLNFKDYENGDDVKRILWKIYAKNKTLMVRHRERVTFNNSESHIYISFKIKNSQEFWSHRGYSLLTLDHYKNVLWNAVKKAFQQNNPLSIHIQGQMDKIMHMEPFKRSLIQQDWIESTSQEWHITHQSVTLIVPDVVDVEWLNNFLQKNAHRIKVIYLVSTVPFQPMSWWQRYLKPLFFKSSLHHDLTFRSDDNVKILNNKKSILTLFSQYTSIQVENMEFYMD